ncbi:class I SAM-dependent methyltransferase [Halomonas denitrificans]|uniref:class I SAM-dependent methyltransferase n=1 Tax=Halomonas TaxID=2745 RepID=UPI001CD6DF04|nr:MULTISPECIES: class I SAM-dependent methyltransferase [Halomonas]MCA0917938.1 class I SAM-dependent methyltransferase [Halomonas denitrificans]MCA0973581.1 class I SAM-dependent methyltransferase [Halomonas denitrificans]MED5294380.1 class I SAM-dependent methyltransferase [Pseudomonadota bacterium]
MSNASEPMELARLIRHARRYWSSDSGQAVRRCERACLGPLAERWCGQHGLELSLAEPLVDMTAVRHWIRWSPTRELAESSSTLVCLPERLPLPDGAVDLVVLNHLLEVVAHPHQLLQEAVRVLAPQGRLVLLGWSPLSVSGLMRLSPRQRRHLPGQGHWRTPGTLRDWLEFVDVEIDRLDYCRFRLPGLSGRNTMLETLGRRYNLPMGDCYIIQARCRSQLACTQGRRPLFGLQVGGAHLGTTCLEPSVRQHQKQKKG